MRGYCHPMPKHLVPILVTLALLPAALVGMGCGSDDSSKSDNGSSSAKSTTPVIPTDASQLKDACIKDAQKMGESKSEATHNCTVPSAKSTNEAAKKLEKECEKTAMELPAGSTRDDAIKECKSSVK
jgi:hypothetical protein